MFKDIPAKYKYAVVHVFLGVILLGGIAAGAVMANAAEKPQERVIITFSDRSAITVDTERELGKLGGRVLKRFSSIPGLVVSLPSEDEVRLARALPGVKRVERDAEFSASQVEASGIVKFCRTHKLLCRVLSERTEWNIESVGAPLAWDVSRGAGVNIAILDSGIDLDHKDLNVVQAVNCIITSTCVSGGDDDNGHGTHVAGIAAALDNRIGVVGVAPEANLFAVKVLDANASGFASGIILGIEWSVANGADVINMSFGGSSDIQALHDAIDAAEAAGVVVVAAAGNNGDGNPATNNVLFPARYDSVIAVASVDDTDTVALSSSDGTEVELAAPGVNVRSTWNNGFYNIISGTSMASPHVTGTAALILGAGTITDINGNGRVNDEVRSLLQQTAVDLGDPGRDVFYGFGLVDAFKSVTNALKG